MIVWKHDLVWLHHGYIDYVLRFIIDVKHLYMLDTVNDIRYTEPVINKNDTPNPLFSQRIKAIECFKVKAEEIIKIENRKNIINEIIKGDGLLTISFYN